jgi:hypothetical protein
MRRTEIKDNNPTTEKRRKEFLTSLKFVFWKRGFECKEKENVWQ